MGIFHSKIAPFNKPSDHLNNFIDPRSPTLNINRSPIGIESALDKPSITKVRDLTADLTEILDNAQTPDRVVASEKQQSALDPRSPSMFLRTPLVLDDSDVSNRSLRGSSIEYEEIGELSFKDCTATDISEVLSVGPIDGASGSIFSNDTSLNTELKADIDNIVQKLYDIGNIKDPRSPSVDIQRTPIVFQEEEEPSNNDEGRGESQTKEEIVEQQSVSEPLQNNIIKEDESRTTTTKITIVHQDENTTTPMMTLTPKRNKSVLSARKTATGAPRTPLGCVTNVQTLTNSTGGNNVLRKTALIGQMKQNVVAGLGSSAEVIPAGKKLQMRSKIPTFRVK